MRWAGIVGNGVDRLTSEPELAVVTDADRNLCSYMGRLIDANDSTTPTSPLSRLVRRQSQGDLTRAELIGLVVLVVVAGYSTVVNFISSMFFLLASRKARLEGLYCHPESISVIIEEFLRLGSPVKISATRFAMQDVAVGGTVIPKGHRVVVMIGAANQDEAVFPGRDSNYALAKKNSHLAFGRGAHSCVGAALARLEGRVVLRCLATIVSDVELVRLPVWERASSGDWIASFEARLQVRAQASC